MKKIFLNTSLSITLALFLTACGGGSSNSMDDNTTQNDNDNPSNNQQTTNPPVIKLEGDKEVRLIVGHPYTEDGVTVTGGSFDGEAEVTVDEVDIYKVGEQTITYTVTDKNGKTGTATRTVIVEPIDELLPADTNLKYAKKNNEDGYIYFADPQPDELGLNRVVRVNYKEMSYDPTRDSYPIPTINQYLVPNATASNPHSVDRAGDTKKFYVRTQNSYSFAVINPSTGEDVKSVPLKVDINGTEVQYSPRAFGAYNAKYNIQLVSGRNSSEKYTLVGIVDVATDELITTVSYPIGDENGSATTGHAKWLDENHFAVIDRGNKQLQLYRIKKENGTIKVDDPRAIPTTNPVHALERVNNVQKKEDLYTFFAMGESGTKADGNISMPFVMKFIFKPENYDSTDKYPLVRAKDENGNELVTWFANTNTTFLKAQNISISTHHAGIEPSGRYFIAPVYDGKIYKIDRETMKIEKPLDALAATSNYPTGKGLGAGHIEFSEQLNLAVVTNHWSEYITIIDMSDFSIKGYVKIYKESHPHDKDHEHLLQPHFSKISDDGKYFYTFASHDRSDNNDTKTGGRFVKVNLEKIKDTTPDENLDFNPSDVIDADLKVGGAPEQSHS